MTLATLLAIVARAPAAFFIWWVLARTDTPFLRWLQRPLRKRASTFKFISCPWCAGAWASLVVALLGLATLDVAHGWQGAVAELIVRWFGTAGLVGLAGTLIPDDGEPDLDD